MQTTSGTGLQTPAAAPEPPQILSRDMGVSIAYRRFAGKSPGVMFFGGFRSDMTGTKAVALETACREAGRAFIRFDYRGHGESSGRFEDGTIGAWADDAIAVLDTLTTGPQILVGSSMGGWIMLLAALARPDRMRGLVGVASAPDFTEDLVWDRLNDDVRRTLRREGVWRQPSAYGDPVPITLRLIEEGRGHLLLGGSIPIKVPVRLLHGMRDLEVPWQTSQKLLEAMESEDVQLHLVKDGDHRLSRPQDLRLIESFVTDLARIPPPISR